MYQNIHSDSTNLKLTTLKRAFKPFTLQIFLVTLQVKTIGEVAEWTNAADSKSVVALVLPGVRIPPSPPIESVARSVILAHLIQMC